MGQDQISNSERGGTPARARNRVWSHGKRQKGVLDVGEMGSEMTGNNDLDVDLKDMEPDYQIKESLRRKLMLKH